MANSTIKMALFIFSAFGNFVENQWILNVFTLVLAVQVFLCVKWSYRNVLPYISPYHKRVRLRTADCPISKGRGSVYFAGA